MEVFMKKVLVTMCMAILILPMLISCSPGGGAPSAQQDAEAAFTALGTATQNVTSGSVTDGPQGPYTWTYTYTLSSGGGYIALTMVSNTNLNVSPYSGFSASFTGDFTFANFPTSAGRFNGTLNVSGSMNVSTAYNGHLMMYETVSYQGAVSVGGGSVSSIGCDFTGNVGMDLTAGTLASVSRTGTVTVDGVTYGVRKMNAKPEGFMLKMLH
jgi:hypothetical protein